MSKKDIDVFSLPPGFIIINYDPEKIDPLDLVADEDTQQEFTRRGYFGGVLLPHNVKVQSLSDADLAELGLERIKPKKEKVKP